MKPSTRIVLLLLSPFAASCSSTSDIDRPTAKDASGNYATTSQYNATYRREFVTSIRAGLDDVDARTRQLESRATQLGQSAVHALHEHLPVIKEKRTAVVNSLTRLEAALDGDWPARRAEVEEAYKVLRSTLDKSHAKVLNE